MSLEELINEMAVLMRFSGGWDARAQGCNDYAHSPDLREAMEAAIKLRSKAPPKPEVRTRVADAASESRPRRRALFDDES